LGLLSAGVPSISIALADRNRGVFAGGSGLERCNMLCEEKSDTTGKLSWVEADPAGEDAPISVWWDDPPAGEDDDGYAGIKANIGSAPTRTPRT